jgi:YaiO family outer membrane protein
MRESRTSPRAVVLVVLLLSPLVGHTTVAFADAADGLASRSDGSPRQTLPVLGDFHLMPSPVDRATGAAGSEGLSSSEGSTGESRADPVRPPWKAAVRYEFQSFSRDRGDWHTVTLAIGRDFSRGTLTLEGLRTYRFSKEDDAVALDGLLFLWPRAYGTSRVQYAVDPVLLPKSDIAVELFQGFGPGWEASASYRTSDIPEERVNVFGVSLAKYFGNWYVRARSTVSTTGELDAEHALTIRRYFGDTGDFVQVEGGAGRELIDVAPGPKVISREVRFVGVRVQKFFSPQFGVSLAGTYRDEVNGPFSGAFSLELLARW